MIEAFLVSTGVVALGEIANVPAVLLGDRAARRIPMRLVHSIAALIFVTLGVLTSLGAGSIV